MKRIVCELCGGSNLIKKDGVFVCQDCGTQYSVEEARKMMVEVSDESSETVKADNTQINNYLEIAKNASDSGNNQEAETYANKIIEVDPQNAEAWFIKGKAAGWQSSLGNVRLTESSECWAKAIELAGDEEKESFGTKIAEEIVSISKALITMVSNNFSRLASASNLESIRTNSVNILSTVSLLKAKTKIPVDTVLLGEEMAQTINMAAVAAFGEANKSFGPEPRDANRYAYTNWLEKVSNCSDVLELALTLAEEEETVNLICENIEVINNRKIESASYKFVATGYGSYYDKDTSLSEESKQYCRDTIKKAKASRDKKLMEIRWRDHPEEKAAIDKEISELDQSIKEIDEEIDRKSSEIREEESKKEVSLPIDSEINDILQEKAKLEQKYKSLGLFNGKAKAEVNSQLDAVKATLLEKEEQKRKELESIENEIEEKIKPVRKDLRLLKTRKSQLQSDKKKKERELLEGRK